MTSANIILPDIFELYTKSEIEEESEQFVIQSISSTVDKISIKRHDLAECPVCGASVIVIDNHVVCLNLNCCATVDLIKIRMVNMFPNLPMRMMMDLVEYVFNNFELECSFIGVIRHIMNHCDEYFHEFETLTSMIVDSLRDVHLEWFFYATIGRPLAEELSLIE